MTISWVPRIGAFWGCPPVPIRPESARESNPVRIYANSESAAQAPPDAKERRVVGPLVVLIRAEISAGKADAYRAYYREMTAAIEANEPRMIGLGAYLDAQARHVTSIQIHPDQASFEWHMQVLRTKIQESFGLLQESSIELLGETDEALTANMRRFGGPGFQLSIRPEHLGGFFRATSA